jgi:hypothetical protein
LNQVLVLLMMTLLCTRQAGHLFQLSEGGSLGKTIMTCMMCRSWIPVGPSLHY